MPKACFTLLLLLTAIPFAGAAEPPPSEPSAAKPNVLFIAVDDLNDWIGCLGGHPQTITPNLDRLAAEGMLFANAHCQAPICGPSRASIMTGLSPNTTGIYLQIKDGNIKKSGPAAASAVFLPDYFERHGYRTLGAGKIYHQGDRAGTFDEFSGGTDMGPKPERRMKWDPAAMGLPGGTQTDWGPFPDRDDQMPDFKTAAYAVEKLNQKHDQPFFLAAGFCRPHVPWHCPQKWFDLHPRQGVETPAYQADDLDDVPAMARRVAAVPMMPTTEWAIENDAWKDMVQAYLACITFVDAQVGKVLDALAASRYADNTVVVLWSDHGYHLGEKNRFAKQAIWERDTRTVLMIKAPGVAPGQRCHAPVQLLDMYPTLLDLCSLPEHPRTEGHSLAPLLEDPDAPWEHVAMSVYGVGNLSLRDRTHRYIVYEDGSEELYDMVHDPNEWTNLASSARHDGVKARFRTSLPDRQAPLARYSRYTINEYWRSKVRRVEESAEK